MEILTRPHWEALTPPTQEAFHLVAQLPFISKFYLAGGTGLALYLGHRFSVDLDFFSPFNDAVSSVQRVPLRKVLDDPTLNINHDQDGTFVVTWREVGINFFQLGVYPLVQQPLIADGISVATLAEIGAMKLAAIIDRGSRKDMVDMYFLLQAIPLETVLQVAAVKYARVRSFPVNAMRGLAYFADAERLPMPRMLDRTPWLKMRKFLEQQAIEFGRKNLADLWQSGDAT